MNKARGITMAVLLAVYSVAGVSSAVAQNSCPYDATGDYDYDPGANPSYQFFGDGKITYDGSIAWYMDDVLGCYNVYKTPGYLPYFPKCDIDGDGQVSIDEVYDIYYRVHPVGQGDAIAQSACAEAFAGGPFFFCHPSRYNRTVGDMQAIIAAYPASGAIVDLGTSGPGHIPEEQLVDVLTCTTPGVFPPGIFDALNDCYLGVETRSADATVVTVDFANALDISLTAAEYSNVAQQFGGVCSPISSGETAGSAPGFHYYKYDDNGWWLWYVRAQEQCSGANCACDITYELWTHADNPGQVWLHSESKNNVGCYDLRFIECDDPTDADGDGAPNCVDECDYDPMKTEPGTCGCGVPDIDADGDGVHTCEGDMCDNDPNKTQPGICGCGVWDEDTNGNGIVDCQEPCYPEQDSDWDGICDHNDPCPLDPNNDCIEYCSPYGDEDGDTICDDVDQCPGEDDRVDTDGDGWPDCLENCDLDPNKTNPGVCGCGVADEDQNGNGLIDCLETQGPCADLGTTFPDCDGPPSGVAVSDGQCIEVCDSSLVAFATINECEIECFGACDTSIDTDGDATPDCYDACPNDPLKIDPGLCGCGLSDADYDGDGIPDECCAQYGGCWCGDGSLPGVCGCGIPDIDSDGDGFLDCEESCDYDPYKTSPGVCGCGVPDTDTDGDGWYDCQESCIYDPYKTEPGVCGCGTPDSDNDGDGYPDCGGPDSCPNDPNKTSPGVCGCGFPDTDTDGDGWYDCMETCYTDPNKTDPGVCGCGIPEGTC